MGQCIVANPELTSTKIQSDPTASKVVDGYTDEMKKRLWNGMPQRAYTEAKAQQKNYVERPKPTFMIDEDDDYRKQSAGVPWHMQIEFRDSKGDPYYMDQAERFNAFNLTTSMDGNVAQVTVQLLFESLMEVSNVVTLATINL